MPLLDLDAIQPTSTPSSWSTTSCSPSTACCRWSSAASACSSRVSDPTNLHALDEIKFQTGPVDRGGRRRGRQAAARRAARRSSRSTRRCRRSARRRLRPREPRRHRRRRGLDDDTVGRDDVEDAPIVRFVNKVMLDAIKQGASDIHFEPYEKTYRIRLRIDGVLKRDRPAAGAARDQARRAPEGHVAARHRRAARAAGRPHQDAAVEEPRDRLPRQHLPDAVRREDRAAYPRPVAARSWASTRSATRQSRRSSTCKALAQAARHDPRDRPDRQRQDRVAVHRPQHPQHRGHATSRPPRTRRKSTCRASTR